MGALRSSHRCSSGQEAAATARCCAPRRRVCWVGPGTPSSPPVIAFHNRPDVRAGEQPEPCGAAALGCPARTWAVGRVAHVCDLEHEVVRAVGQPHGQAHILHAPAVQAELLEPERVDGHVGRPAGGWWCWLGFRRGCSDQQARTPTVTCQQLQHFSQLGHTQAAAAGLAMPPAAAAAATAMAHQ